jgi:hypothetical protein
MVLVSAGEYDSPTITLLSLLWTILEILLGDKIQCSEKFTHRFWDKFLESP